MDFNETYPTLPFDEQHSLETNRTRAVRELRTI